MQTRQRVLVVLGLLVSAFFLFLAFRGLHPEEFVGYLRDINGGTVVLAGGVYFGAVALISWRWQFFLRSVQYVPLTRLIQKVAVGYMGNNVYPLRAGEALRIFLLQRQDGVPVFRATTTVIVERIFDGLVMLGFILVGLSLSGAQSPVIQTVVSVALPLFGVGILVFFILARLPHPTKRLVASVAQFLPHTLGQWLVRLSDEVLNGLGVLQNPLHLVGAILASIASWMVEAFVYWMVMGAFSLDLGYPVALLVVGTVNLAGLIPASPGQFGVYEYFASSVLVAVGVPQSQALSYAIVTHITIWLPVTVVGFAFLAYYGLGLNALQQAQKL